MVRALRRRREAGGNVRPADLLHRIGLQVTVLSEIPCRVNEICPARERFRVTTRS